MRKQLVAAAIAACFGFGCTSLAYAGSSILSFSGGGGRILIVTTAPGITIDNFEVTSGGDYSAVQELSTSSPTVIMREGEYSGGGSIMTITETADPQVQFGAYLASDNSGYLGQLVSSGFSAEFQLSARSSGEGTLEIGTDTEEQFDFQSDLMFDDSTMAVLVSGDPFHLSWLTQFDTSAEIDLVGWGD